jgi:hypothetical protein
VNAPGATVTVHIRMVPASTDGVATEAFSVEGQVESVDGTRADFSGWMGLVNSLERLLVRAPGSPVAGADDA